MASAVLTTASAAPARQVLVERHRLLPRALLAARDRGRALAHGGHLDAADGDLHLGRLPGRDIPPAVQRERACRRAAPARSPSVAAGGGSKGSGGMDDGPLPGRSGSALTRCCRPSSTMTAALGSDGRFGASGSAARRAGPVAGGVARPARGRAAAAAPSLIARPRDRSRRRLVAGPARVSAAIGRRGGTGSHRPLRGRAGSARGHSLEAVRCRRAITRPFRIARCPVRGNGLGLRRRQAPARGLGTGAADRAAGSRVGTRRMAARAPDGSTARSSRAVECTGLRLPDGRAPVA